MIFQMPKGRRQVIFDLLGTVRVRVLDIGARGGLPHRWRWAQPVIQETLFEAEENEAARLGRSVLVAGEEQGSGILNVTRSAGCSSLLKPNRTLLDSYPEPERFEVVHKQPVGIVRVDDTVEAADFIKIDVQGAALAVLQGAENVLGGVTGVEVEAEILAMYQGQALFTDIIAWMQKADFELCDLRPTYWRRSVARDIVGCRGQIIFCDALFMRTPESLARMVTSNKEPVDTLMRALAVCEVYGLSDYIIAYAHACAVEDTRIARWVRLAERRPPLSHLARFRAVRAIGLILKDIGDVLQSAHWSFAEQRLGNTARQPWLKFFR